MRNHPLPLFRVLDVCSGYGLLARGLMAAGAHVTGVDTNAACGRYYPGDFIHGDGLDYLARHGHEYDAIVSGFPCQRFTQGLAARPDIAATYPNYLHAGRALMIETGKPYVIENVTGARAHLRAPFLLCGRMFGLEATDSDGARLVLDRHRLFETNVPMLVPPHVKHGDELVGGAYGSSRRWRVPKGTPHYVSAPMDRYAAKKVRKGGYVPRAASVRAALLGLDPGDPMPGKGMELGVPPAYGRFLGERLLEHLTARAAA